MAYSGHVMLTGRVCPRDEGCPLLRDTNDNYYYLPDGKKKLKKKITVRSVKLVMPYIHTHNAHNALYRIYYYFQLTATEEKNAVHVFI